MAKQAMLLDFQKMAFKNFRPEVAHKKPELKFLVKKTYFIFIFIIAYFTGNMLFAVLKNECIKMIASKSYETGS